MTLILNKSRLINTITVVTMKPIAIREHNYVTLSISDFPSYCNNRYDFDLNRILYSTFVGNLTNETRVTKEMLKNI